MSYTIHNGDGEYFERPIPIFILSRSLRVLPIVRYFSRKTGNHERHRWTLSRPTHTQLLSKLRKNL